MTLITFGLDNSHQPLESVRQVRVDLAEDLSSITHLSKPAAVETNLAHLEIKYFVAILFNMI